MASLNVKTEYSEYKDCKLRVGKYVEDNSVAVEIYNRWDGPIARVTTCLCDHSLAEDEAYVDTNNCPWAVALLEEKLKEVLENVQPLSNDGNAQRKK